MADESIILAVELDTKKALTQFDLLAQSIEDAKKRQDELNKQFKEGAITTEEYNKATKENTKEIKAAETATKSLTTAIKSEANSINDLRAQNRELEKQRNALGILNDSNKDKFKALNDQINKNNDLIKDNVSNLEKQRLNIGNYASALEGVRGSLDKVVPGLSGMTDGIIGVSNGAKALGSTPLLGIFTILSTVVPVVVDYFKSFAPVMDAIEDSVNAVTGTFKGLFENFNLLIKAIGGSGKDWDALKTAISETRAEGQRLLDVQRELDDAYLDYQLRAAKGGVEIKKLLLEAKNRTLTEKERQDKLNQALDIEVSQREELIKLDKTAFESSVDQFIFDNTKRLKGTQELIDIETKRADEKIAQESRFGLLSAERRSQIIAERDAEIERIKTSDVLINQLKQTEDRYEKLQILRQSGLFDEKDLQSAVDAFIKYQSTVEGGVAIQERIQNQLDASAQAELTRQEKQREAAAKKKEEDEKELARLTELQRIEESFAEAEKNRVSDLDQYKVDSQKTIAENIKEIVKTNEEELTEIVQEETDKRNKINEENAKNRELREILTKKAIEKAAFDTLSFITNTVNRANQRRIASYKRLYDEGKITEDKLNQLSNESAKRYKAFALGEIAVNYAVGLANAITIAQQQTKKTGGFSLPLFLAVQISTLLATISKARAVIDSTSFSGGSSGLGGGVAVSSGVTETRATTNPINERFNLANANQGMSVVASWQEATTVRNRVEFKEQLTTV